MTDDSKTARGRIDRGLLLLLVGAGIIAALWIYAIAAHRLGGGVFAIGLPVVTGIHIWRWARWAYLRRRAARG